jgi:NADH-quinone oxidoreductase subunit G
MLKQGGQWIETDWQTALEYVAKGLKGIAAITARRAGALASAHSTAEELFLVKQLAVACANIDFRLRQPISRRRSPVRRGSACRSPICRTWCRVVVGSFLRKTIRCSPHACARPRRTARSCTS